MGQAKQRGTREERVNQAAQNKEQNKEPERFFGFKSEHKPEETLFDIDENDLVCMVSSITKMNLSEVQEDWGNKFKIGQWFCSAGSHEKTVVYGPFTLNEAFEFGRTEKGAVRFVKEINWEN